MGGLHRHRPSCKSVTCTDVPLHQCTLLLKSVCDQRDPGAVLSDFFCTSLFWTYAYQTRNETNSSKFNIVIHSMMRLTSQSLSLFSDCSPNQSLSHLCLASHLLGGHGHSMFQPSHITERGIVTVYMHICSTYLLFELTLCEGGGLCFFTSRF